MSPNFIFDYCVPLLTLLRVLPCNSVTSLLCYLMKYLPFIGRYFIYPHFWHFLIIIFISIQSEKLHISPIIIRDTWSTYHWSTYPLILPSHLLRTSSYMNFFRKQCNFILYKYTHTFFFFFHFFLYFYQLIFFFFFYLIYFFFSSSGMFRNVPECSMFLVLSTAV